MSSVLRLITLFFVLIVSFQLSAKPEDAASKKITAVLEAQFPGISIENIAPSPVPELYQVSAGAKIIYVTGDGRYALNGDLIDLGQRQNMTEMVRKSARLKAFEAIPKEYMIVFPAKDPKHTLTVFTDIDCGYCRKLQSEMKQINDAGITVQYLAFPRTGPNTPSFNKTISVWCARDKNDALAKAKQNKEVDSNLCTNNGVIEQFKFGESIGVMGTPTLLFEDGTLIPSYVPPEKIRELVEQFKKPAS